MATDVRIAYLTLRARVGESTNSPMPALLKKEMEFEREFVKAGGLLIAGPDPTGYGGVVAGFGDRREVELLVEAGFTPVEAIGIATHNGALYLGELDRIGTLAAGKQADLVLIKGDPAKGSRSSSRMASAMIPPSSSSPSGARSASAEAQN